MSEAHLQEVDAEMERRWTAYVEAREVAERSDHIADGIAAGMAWKAFLDVFGRDPVFRKTLDAIPAEGI